MSVLDQHFRRFLEEPGGHVVISPEGIIERVGPEYLRLTRSSGEDIRGIKLTDTIRDSNPKRLQQTISLVEEALEISRDGMIEKIPAFRSDTPDEKAWRERWWEVTTIPLVNERNNVEHIVVRLEDVTATQISLRAVRTQRNSGYLLYVLVLLAVGLIAWKLTALTDINHRLALRATRDEAALKQTVLEGREQRFLALRQSCQSVNKLTTEIRQLIIVSTLETKHLDPSLRRLGLPSFQQRLRQAHKEANSLTLVNCQPISVRR